MFHSDKFHVNKWNLNLDGAKLAALFHSNVFGRDGWVMPPQDDGVVAEDIHHPTLPDWICIGAEHDEYNFKLVHAWPLVYRCTRSSADRWSQPGPNDVLWLFEKCGTWVAGHANRDTTRICMMLEDWRLVWSTTSLLPVLPGEYDWYWVDAGSSRTLKTVVSPWFYGQCRTQEIAPPPMPQRSIDSSREQIYREDDEAHPLESCECTDCCAYRAGIRSWNPMFDTGQRREGERLMWGTKGPYFFRDGSYYYQWMKEDPSCSSDAATHGHTNGER